MVFFTKAKHNTSTSKIIRPIDIPPIMILIL